MTKPIEDTNNAAAIRTALDVPTTGALNTVGDAAQAAAETAAAKYTKPSTGIPASDLAAAAKTSLGKADSAIQDLAGMTAKFNAGTAPEKAAFQSLVSGDLPTRLAIGGDSFTAPESVTSSWTDNVWWVHALSEMGWSYEVVAVGAVAGRSVEAIRDALATEVLPFRPHEYWGILGQNNRTDVAQALSGLAALDDMIATLRANGVRRIVCGTPCDDTSITTSNRDALTVFENGLRDRARAGKIEIAETWSYYRSPTTGAADPTLTIGDNFHPNRKGARRLGRAFVDAVYSRQRPYSAPALRGIDDSRLTTAYSNNLVSNPGFTGTTGTKTGSGTITGTMPTGWIINVPAGVNVDIAVVDDTTSRQRRWLSLTITGTLSATSSIGVNQLLNLTTLGVPAGSSMRHRINYRVSGLSPNIYGFGAGVLFFTGASAAAGGATVGGGALTLLGGEIAENVVLTKETGIAVVGSNGATAATLQNQFSILFAAGTVTGTLMVCEPQTRQLS